MLRINLFPSVIIFDHDVLHTYLCIAESYDSDEYFFSYVQDVKKQHKLT